MPPLLPLRILNGWRCNITAVACFLLALQAMPGAAFAAPNFVTANLLTKVKPPAKSAHKAERAKNLRIPQADRLVKQGDAAASANSKAALSFYKQALSLYQQHGGKNATATAVILVKIAGELEGRHDHKGAEAQLKLAQAIRGDDPKMVEIVDGDISAKLGNCYLNAGTPNSDKLAIEPLKRALAIYEHFYGIDSAHVYNVLTSLASAYQQEGDAEMESTVTQHAQDVLLHLPIKYGGVGTAAHSNFNTLLRQEETSPKTTTALR